MIQISISSNIDIVSCQHFSKELNQFSRHKKILPNFSSNQLIRNSGDVEALNINFNPSIVIFSGIGEKFGNLQRLQIIDDGLKFLDRNNFLNLPHLQELSLHHNPFKFIAEDVFWDLINLEHLNIHKCQLEKVPSRLLFSMPNLEGVDLSENVLSFIPKTFFKYNIKLQEVFLKGNNLKKIEIDFMKFGKINTVDVSENVCINKKWYSKTEGWYSNLHLTSTSESLQELQQVIKQKCY